MNFYGIIEDHVHTSQVESILIGGKYQDIPVYQEMHNHKNHHGTSDKKLQIAIDPKQNKILLNLKDIKSISLQHPHSPTANTIVINHKQYIQIIIELINGTKKHYLVESLRKITCNEINTSHDKNMKPTLQHRDLNFIHIKKLTIKGYKKENAFQAAQPEPISNIQSPEKTTADFKNNAAELLQAIEENVKNLPLENSSAFKTMQATIITLLKSLRDQLQKFLDMIK